LLGVHSRYGLHTRAVTVFRDTLSEGFSYFVTSIAAPVASGWSGCRVGLAPTGKRRLFTAHTHFGPQRVRFCRDAQDGPPATGKHAETINHIVGPRWEFFILPNPDISPESAVADPELPRTAVVMLMEPARSA
jgi:hypothetical protein